jgi:hypothetical protein
VYPFKTTCSFVTWGRSERIVRSSFSRRAGCVAIAAMVCGGRPDGGATGSGGNLGGVRLYFR